MRREEHQRACWETWYGGEHTHLVEVVKRLKGAHRRAMMLEVVLHELNEAEGRRLHLGDDLLNRPVLEVDGDARLNDEDRALDARVGELDAGERRKEDLVLVRVL